MQASKLSVPNQDSHTEQVESDQSGGEPAAVKPGLSSQRISRKDRSRSSRPGRRVAAPGAHAGTHSYGKTVAIVAGVLAVLVVLKVILFPAQISQPDISTLDNDQDVTWFGGEQVASAPKQTGMVIQAGDFTPSLFFASGQNEFPTRLDIDVQGYEFPLQLEYTLDPGLQAEMVKWLDRYDPDFAVAVAIDPDSGRILALTTHVSDGRPLGNLAMSSAFPAASVFKIVTAAAALDMGKLNPQSVVPFNGKSTTLYKQNVFEHKNNKWTRKPTLSEAFAKSVNTVFGRIGLYTVGPQQLNNYAQRFFFNTRIDTDIAIDPSTTYIPLTDDWAVAEAASGYTNRVTLSPLHGAAVAASMINGGKLMRPYLVDRAYDEQGRLVYKGQPDQLGLAITPETAKAMQTLMSKTVKMGTARRSYGDFFKGQYADMHVGGKTGSLSGGDLQGRNDWFVGYAYDENRKLAFAILNINLEKWKVKSHYLSRLMIEQYFDSDADVKMTAGIDP